MQSPNLSTNVPGNAVLTVSGGMIILFYFKPSSPAPWYQFDWNFVKRHRQIKSKAYDNFTQTLYTHFNDTLRDTSYKPAKDPR